MKLILSILTSRWTSLVFAILLAVCCGMGVAHHDIKWAVFDGTFSILNFCSFLYGR